MSSQFIIYIIFRYFTLYDSNRDDLLPAYHPDCMLSLCVPPTRGPPLSVYFPHSRNLRGMKDSGTLEYSLPQFPLNSSLTAPRSLTDAKISTLKSSQLTVCALLKKLPDTEHDLPGFNVDVPFVSPTLVKFIIRGVFRQKSNSQFFFMIQIFEFLHDSIFLVFQGQKKKICCVPSQDLFSASRMVQGNVTTRPASLFLKTSKCLEIFEISDLGTGCGNDC